MIEYDGGSWGFSVVCRVRGSVFQKAFTVALPSAVLAIVLQFLLKGELGGELTELGEKLRNQMDGMNTIWSGYTTVLGFLIVFRNNQAYTRFWEGATLINQVRGEWFNAVSCLIAFCSRDAARQDDVRYFQYSLVRLASILYCFALQQICALDDDALEILKIDTMDTNSAELLTEANDKCEVVVQWIQRFIVESSDSKVIDIPPPILTRAFQELSRGIVNLNNVRKISEIPFPFPYAQTLTVMLLVHWLVTPMMAAAAIDSSWWAGIMCFLSVASFWSLYYIALEIDQPFGEDKNDLPIREMQKDFNRSILVLLDERTQAVPSFLIRSPQELHNKPSLTQCKSDFSAMLRQVAGTTGERGPRRHRHSRYSNRLTSGAKELPDTLRNSIASSGASRGTGFSLGVTSVSPSDISCAGVPAGDKLLSPEVTESDFEPLQEESNEDGEAGDANCSPGTHWETSGSSPMEGLALEHRQPKRKRSKQKRARQNGASGGHGHGADGGGGGSAAGSRGGVHSPWLPPAWVQEQPLAGPRGPRICEGAPLPPRDLEGEAPRSRWAGGAQGGPDQECCNVEDSWQPLFHGRACAEILPIEAPPQQPADIGQDVPDP